MVVDKSRRGGGGILAKAATAVKRERSNRWPCGSKVLAGSWRVNCVLDTENGVRHLNRKTLTIRRPDCRELI